MLVQGHQGQGWTSNESSEFEAIRIYNQRTKPRRAALTNERPSVRSITIEFKVIRSYHQRIRPRRAAPTSEQTSVRSILYQIKYIRVCSCSFDLFDLFNSPNRVIGRVTGRVIYNIATV